ncbi:phage EaA protein [Klebsiella pneumoniae]|uniref:ead/Ea22-like family protein n=1 Tax=Klebsiella pneumoniae TaxID=573 RepID=UPI000E2CEC9B|nr:ead/Ea22-like family protein [Klebsiella pneumoniae]MDE9300296.1 ead/Ea22-like family protein [Klebsiella pneumoniae]MDZ6236266.1 ead/Ea22-like family protein [Klebsiella pneumoniae]SXK98548.1 phage EaA protein [Klebsiella pneumoniae]SYF95081.1 phage EaA protein [Klebsiella pneumoniae]HBR3346805.1 ead/Ea22-like family protein [Klebsiella pneumoniae]
MTDITELAQSLKAAANTTADAIDRLKAFPGDELIDLSQHQGEQVDIDITTLNEWYELSSPANILALVEALEKAQQRIDELENDEVCQRLANAEHQLYMAELAKHNLKASRKAQFSKRKASEKRIAELEAQNEYIRKRYQQLDLLIGKNILVMQAAIIEWQTTGDAKNGLAWIYNTLFGPGELPDEAEKDAQAYFDRKYAPLDEELMALHKWFWEQSEAERAAAGIKVEDE